MTTYRTRVACRRNGARPGVVLVVLLLIAVTGCAAGSPAQSAPELASALDRVDSAVVSGRSAAIEEAVNALILATRQAQGEGRIDLAEADRIVAAAENVLAQLPDDAPRSPESSPSVEPSAPVESPSVDPTPGGGESKGKGKGKKKKPGRGKP